MKPITLRAHEVRQLQTAGEVLVVRRIKWPVYGAWAGGKRRVMTEREAEKITAEIDGGLLHRPVCPHGMPRERRWVRETWAYGVHAMASARDEEGPFVYAATNHGEQGRLCDRWRSPVVMPRWASRYVVEIAEVQARQVQAITEAEAIAAGVRTTFLPLACADGTRVWHVDNYPTVQCSTTSAVDAYGGYFETVHGPDSWDANPWVWLARARMVEA